MQGFSSDEEGLGEQQGLLHGNNSTMDQTVLTNSKVNKFYEDKTSFVSQNQQMFTNGDMSQYFSGEIGLQRNRSNFQQKIINQSDVLQGENQLEHETNPYKIIQKRVLDKQLDITSKQQIDYATYQYNVEDKIEDVPLPVAPKQPPPKIEKEKKIDPDIEKQMENAISKFLFIFLISSLDLIFVNS